MTERPSAEGAPDAPEIDERGIAQVPGASRRGSVLGLIVGGALLVPLLVYVWREEAGQDEAEAGLMIPTTEVPEAVPGDDMGERGTGIVSAPLPDLPASALAVVDPFAEEMQRRALAQAAATQALAEQRRRSAVLVFDRGAQLSDTPPRVAEGLPAAFPFGPDFPGIDAAEASEELDERLSAERFAERISGAEAATAAANFIGAPGHTIAEGTTIDGVLETAIDSDLPGLVRAVVSRDVYSFDGSRRLIPSGSRLIGQYQSGLTRGQTRVFVVWTRLLRPDGASILLGSPGADPLGRAGLSGEIDTHVLKIFGASTLLSLIDGAIEIGIERVRSRGGGTTTLLQGNARAPLGRASEIALERAIDIPPTIRVEPGARITVFVNKDLDFRKVEPGA